MRAKYFIKYLKQQKYFFLHIYRNHMTIFFILKLYLVFESKYYKLIYSILRITLINL